MRWNASATSLRAARCCALLVLLVVALFGLHGRAGAQDQPLRAAASDPYWVAAYWNNTALTGEPVLTRQESNLDNRWGGGSPDRSVNSDFFSARWTRYLYLTEGVYRFSATSDDGVRLWVDDRLLIDQWREQAARTFVVDRFLAAGHHLVRVEYFEATGDATAILTWERVGGGGTPPPAITDWRAEFFNNRDLSGDPALVRNDRSINFDWGSGSPAPGQVDSNNFTARWTRNVNLDAGNYRFTVTVDDGVRLWVNNARIIDEWREQSPRTFSSDIYLPGGSIPIRLEYLELTGNAQVRLDWQRTDQPAPPPDDDDDDDIADGSWRGEYYDNGSLSGSPFFVRHDANIHFDWGYGSPQRDMDPDWFSVRWTRTIFTGQGRHRFTTETDDGVRLWVDGRLVIDQWGPQGRTRHSASLDLDRGNHTVVMEYQERTQLAFARLTIAGPAQPQNPVGNIVTCVPPQPDNYAWIKLYRLDGNNNWVSIGRGIGTVNPSGFLKLDGLPVDTNRFGDRGEPYKVEMWVNSRVATSTGDFQRGEPEFRVRAFVDNYTPWQCGQ